EVSLEKAKLQARYRRSEISLRAAILSNLLKCLGAGSALRKENMIGMPEEKFITHTEWFLNEAFSCAEGGSGDAWQAVSCCKNSLPGIEDKYAYVRDIQTVLAKNPTIREELGDNALTPDIVVVKEIELSWECESCPARDGNGIPGAGTTMVTQTKVVDHPLAMCAAISCKWTIRSDRAQNTRTEALNLIRNRKGNTPHIVAVTFEPLPSRLSSLALGTGDLDCMYHVALPELVEAIRETKSEDHIEQIETLVKGRRLRDISDLPVDLAI
ncbi:MAG: hypothetical protein JW720_00615, partial [Sedimentisphaerales bacterium]|nr:hypothetical protein [Sedimentisphaerales bacterium]